MHTITRWAKGTSDNKNAGTVPAFCVSSARRTALHCRCASATGIRHQHHPPLLFAMRQHRSSARRAMKKLGNCPRYFLKAVQQRCDFLRLRQLPFELFGQCLGDLVGSNPDGLVASWSAYSTMVRLFSLHRMIPMDGFSSSCRTCLSRAVR